MPQPQACEARSLPWTAITTPVQFICGETTISTLSLIGCLHLYISRHNFWRYTFPFFKTFGLFSIVSSISICNAYISLFNILRSFELTVNIINYRQITRPQLLHSQIFQGFFSWFCEAALAPSFCENKSRKLFKIVEKHWLQTFFDCFNLSGKLLEFVNILVVIFII